MRANPGHDRGFTLVEALIAMALLALFMLATAQALWTSMAAGGSATARSTASALTQSKVEELLRAPFSSLSSHAVPIVTRLPGSGLDYATSWTFARYSTFGTLAVTTSWRDDFGRHQVRIETARGDH